MARHIFTFLATFIVGAVIALAVRTATHDPHADHAAQPSLHAGHAATATSAAKPVNTVCAICGMPVDSSVPTAQYQGKTIGFGCKLCPPKFAAEPDKYGPLYLRNEVVKR